MRSRELGIVTGLGFVVLLSAALALAPAARAGSVVVPPRPGQVGISVSGLYGTLLNQGVLGSEFGSGAGVAVRLRYRMRFERGFGLSFEQHGCDVRSGTFRDLVDPDSTYAAGTDFAPTRANLYLYGLDFYQMYGTRTKTVKMVSVGAGLAHPTIRLGDGESQFPWSDGTYLSVGAGVERFFWQGVAWDLGARYQVVFINGSTNHDFQVSAGVVFYASL